jgi:diacylglycerol O-acyltransferase / wax synthase
MPTEAALLEDVRARRRASTRARLSALAHPVKGVRRMLSEWPAIRELLAERPLAATSLDRVVGQDRKLSLIRCELQPIKDAAHAHGAKVNDVLLAGIAGGLRALLSSRREPVEGRVLRIYVPVSLHQGVRAAARGNLIAQMVVELPIGVADAITRLRQIAAETKERESRTRPSLGKVPHRGIAGRLFIKLVDRQRVNVSSADIPGPESPLYFAGARLLEVFPMLQLLGKNSLTVGAMSYAGRFNTMVVADRDAYPDLDVFVAGMQTELSALIGELSKSAAA